MPLKKIAAHFSSENPSHKKDELAVKKKFKEALMSLDQLDRALSSLEEPPTDFYDTLCFYPHFLELVMETVFLEFVKTENECLDKTKEESAAIKKKFLKFMQPYLRQIVSWMKQSVWAQ